MFVLPLAALPMVNEVQTSAAGYRLFCDKPAMVSRNSAYAEQSDRRLPAGVIDACRAGFAVRERQAVSLLGLGSALIIVGLVGTRQGRATGRRRPVGLAAT